MFKIIFDMGDRKVHWNLEPEAFAIVAESLVSALGPAEEGE